MRNAFDTFMRAARDCHDSRPASVLHMWQAMRNWAASMPINPKRSFVRGKAKAKRRAIKAPRATIRPNRARDITEAFLRRKYNIA